MQNDADARTPASPETVRPLTSMAAMTGLLLADQTVGSVLAMVVTMAQSVMAGIDGASVTVVRTGAFQTNSSTSEGVRDADGVQYRTGKGPCLEATRRGVTVNIGLVESRSRWPEFSDAALAAGFRGVLSTSLTVGGVSVGSLNLYSRTQVHFSLATERAAGSFADQASVVLSNAAAFATAKMLNDQLREALVTRDVLGQAKGILMERKGCSADEAFELLRQGSQDTNRKLRDVATDVANSAQAAA